jgi:hypothetical protein
VPSAGELYNPASIIFLLFLPIKYDILLHGTTVLQGALTSILCRNGGDAMKNQKNFDFKDMIAFGTFLLALLTFIFMFCK